MQRSESVQIGEPMSKNSIGEPMFPLSALPHLSRRWDVRVDEGGCPNAPRAPLVTVLVRVQRDVLAHDVDIDVARPGLC
eukprot:12182382-Heterocapsa_arctica.AAC.1